MFSVAVASVEESAMIPVKIIFPTHTYFQIPIFIGSSFLLSLSVLPTVCSVQKKASGRCHSFMENKYDVNNL